MVDYEPFEPVPFEPNGNHDAPQPFWTRSRIVYAVIAIIVIIAFLTLVMWPTIIAITQPQQPTPVPTTPLPRVSLSRV